MLHLLVLLLTGTPAIAALSEWAQGLQEYLVSGGFNNLSIAIGRLEETQLGNDLLEVIEGMDHLTIFAPIDSAWLPSPWGDLTEADDIAEMLSYHIVTTNLTPETLPAPPDHTVAFTLYKSEDRTLSGDETQVLVVETLDGGNGVVCRKPDWNLTSIGSRGEYSQAVIWGVEGIIQLPIDSYDVLSKYIDYPHATTPSSWKALVDSVLDLADTSCYGCTYFVPDNTAMGLITSVLSYLSDEQRLALVLNHIINNTVIYSSQFSRGDTFITAAGQTLAYGGNDTGDYFIMAGVGAQYVRADIPVANGVMHLINAVLFDVTYNEEYAEEAAEWYLDDVPEATKVDGIAGVIQTLYTVPMTAPRTVTTTLTQSQAAGAHSTSTAAQWSTAAGGQSGNPTSQSPTTATRSPLPASESPTQTAECGCEETTSWSGGWDLAPRKVGAKTSKRKSKSKSKTKTKTKVKIGAHGHHNAADRRTAPRHSRKRLALVWSLLGLLGAAILV